MVNGFQKNLAFFKFRSMLATASVSVFSCFSTLLIDKILAGRFFGEDALASITLFSSILSICFCVGSCIAVGSLVCYTFNMGMMKKERASDFFSQGIILSVIAGVIICLLLFGFRQTWNPDSMSPSVFGYLNDFSGWFFVYAMFTPLYMTLRDLIYADGDTLITKISLGVLLCGNVLISIVACSYIGFAGVSFGSAVATALAILTLFLHFFRKNNTLSFHFHLKWRDTIAVFRYSAVESYEYLLLALLLAVLCFFFTHSYGSEMLVVLSILFDVIELSVIFGGVWQAAEPIINIFRGEENTLGVAKLMKVVNIALLKEGSLCAILLFIFAPLVAKVFNVQTEELLTQVVFAIRVICVAALASCFLKVYASYYLHEKPWLALFIVSMHVFVSPLLMVLLFDALGGLDFVWFGLALSPFVALVVVSLLILRRYGKADFPLLLEKVNKKILMFDAQLTQAGVMELRNKVGYFVKMHGICRQSQMRLMLLIEEMGMHAVTENAPYVPLCEVTLFFDDEGVVVIYKDDGKILDMTDLEQEITNLRSYVLTSLMASQQIKSYLLTMSFNRLVFKFPRDESVA